MPQSQSCPPRPHPPNRLPLPPSPPTPTPDAITLCNIPQDPQLEFTLIDNDLLKSYLTYLNQGGDWQKLLVFSAHRIIPLDLDNDQNQDFLLENQNDLHLLYCTQDGYRGLELSQELITPNHQTVQKQLLTYGDYNQNQKPEFFLQAPFCDLDFCYTHLEILEWDGKELANILETPIDNLRYPQADLEKVEGAYQLIVRSNPIPTTKSGLVRDEELRFSPHPSTGHWQKVSQTYDLSPYRLHYLIDGENAYAAGDYELAKAFYPLCGLRSKLARLSHGGVPPASRKHHRSCPNAPRRTSLSQWRIRRSLRSLSMDGISTMPTAHPPIAFVVSPVLGPLNMKKTGSKPPIKP